jgi:CheY-like chemotaxis protein
MKSEGKQPRARRLRVLVADESAASRVSLAFNLAELADVEVAGFAWTGMDALRLIRDMRPDLAILHLGMPGLDGVEILDALRRQRLPTPVMIMAGSPRPGDRQKCLQLGAKHFFQKTADCELMMAVVNGYAQRRRMEGRKGGATVSC